MTDETKPPAGPWPLSPLPPPPAAPRRRTFWEVLGIVLAVVLAIFGLLVVGMFVLVAISLNSWGNNK